MAFLLMVQRPLIDVIIYTMVVRHVFTIVVLEVTYSTTMQSIMRWRICDIEYGNAESDNAVCLRQATGFHLVQGIAIFGKTIRWCPWRSLSELRGG